MIKANSGLGKRVLTAALVVLFFTAFTAAGASAADTITVCSSGCDYTTIQAAVDAASAGDAIVAIPYMEKAERVVAQDLNYTTSYVTGNQINFSKGVNGDLVINDSIGDVAYDFIDIKQGIISVNDINLTVRIQLVNIPHQLLFDKTNVTDWYEEYEWALYIDIDGNTSTGCPYTTVGTEYAISCRHFKSPDSIPHYDSLINGTQRNVWVYNSSGEYWHTDYGIYEVYANVDYDTNTLTMVGTPFNSTILNTSKFYIVTCYNSGDHSFERDFAALPVPKSEIHVHKKEYLSTYDTYIDHNKIYDFTPRWTANVWDVENLNNVTYTITTSKNFTYIDNYERYQNGTENTFILPPTIEGQNYIWALPLKDRIGSGISFVLGSSQTVQDNPWADMEVNTTNEGDYTRVNVTFKPVIPLDWCNLQVRGDQIIDVSAYPPEFFIDALTSSYVELDSGDLNQDQVYNFSVLVDNPNEVNLWLDATFGWEVESPSDIITLAIAELGGVTVNADVPVIWEHTSTLPQGCIT